MDMSFNKADLKFRDDVRAFIAEKYDEDLRRKMSFSKNGYLDKAGQLKWQKALNDRGWAAVNWPKEHGGAGFTPNEKYIFDIEMAAAGTPIVSPMGLKMVAPVIMAFGNDTQKKRHLPSILRSDIWWCQGYSEPGSGSDLASLQMRAEDNGDHYICNGSKIWTTHAQWADWIFCLVRTTPGQKPQQGISFILIDMKTPGITVRPIVTIDGPPDDEQEINQVFFDNVRVPKENLIGKQDEGWTYAKYLLEFERGNAYAPGLKRSLKKVRSIAAAEGSNGSKLIEDAEFRRKIEDVEIQLRALEFTEMRFFSKMSTGQRPGAESSLFKTRGTELQQAITELALEAVQYSAMPFVQNPWAKTNEPWPQPDYAVTTAPYYFSLRKASIYAGSNEIQRNIMAKMVLGL